MKFNFIIEDNLREGIENLKEFLPIEEDAGGIKLYSEKTSEKYVEVSGNSDEIRIKYNAVSQFFYGFSYCIQNYGKNFHVKKISQVERLGIMRDCARNAILSFSGVKKLVYSMALLGYNYLELYMEDLMEIKEYPYLGFARGRYTPEEIKAYDKYALSFGIELVPCIQTLAHLPCLFKNDYFEKIHDKDDILLVDDENTYLFIDKILQFCSDNFSSRRINIGMDEAYSMFLGKYLDLHGYEKDRAGIFIRHLSRVIDLCKKYGFKPSMWSDMVFKVAFNISDNNAYTKLKEKKFDSEFINNFPKDVSLIYWDYYHDTVDAYDEKFDKHFEITDNIIFAGGVWTWTSFAPSNSWAERVFSSAYESGIKHKCNDFLLTSWGDNGGECTVFSALSSFAYCADKVYGGDGKELNSKMKALFGNTYDEFKNIENVDKPFDFCDKKGMKREDVVTTSKYALYNDPLIGVLDLHVGEFMDEKYKQRAKEMKRYANKKGIYSYVFNCMSSLCEALSLKATLGIKIRKLYKEKNIMGLEKVIKTDIPLTIKKVEKFYSEYRNQWLKDNKSFGFEVSGIRIGGVIMRLKETKRVLTDYIEGKISRIEELDRERIPVYSFAEEGEILYYNSFSQGMTGSLI